MKLLSVPLVGQDLTGLRFGKRVVTAFAGVRIWKSGNKQKCWIVQCDCGNKSTQQQCNLKSGRAQSCACTRADLLRKLRTQHGYTKDRQTHPMYQSWANMLTRCYNRKTKSWKNYGKRGIRVCSRWRKFELFRQDMEADYFNGASIERKNVNGDYDPSNCTWLAKKLQQKNTRRTRKLSLNGKTRILADWIKETGITSIPYRLRTGWSLKRALTEPARKP